MTALTVLCFTLIALRLAALVLQGMVARGSAATGGDRPPFDPGPGPFPAACPPPVSDEGRLVASLLSGRISRERYRREMSELASADVCHRPH